MKLSFASVGAAALVAASASPASPYLETVQLLGTATTAHSTPTFVKVSHTTVDLTGILRKHGIDSQLAASAPGNEGRASLQHARLNLNTGRFDGKVTMRAHHVWKAGPIKTNAYKFDFNVFVRGHVAVGRDNRCTIHIDDVATSNDILKALHRIADAFTRVFTLGHTDLTRFLLRSAATDCGI